MEIYIIRHAETAKNRAKVLQGRSNAPLNEAGEQQSEKAGEFFRKKGIVFDRIYSSPLTRCIQTARIIAGKTNPGFGEDAPGSGSMQCGDSGNGENMINGESLIVTDDRLLEMDYGPYEGMSLDSPPPEIIHFFSDFVHNKEPEGMESLDSVKERMRAFLLMAADNPCRNMLIATHAIAMKGALEVLTPDSGGSYWSRYIGNCAVYHASFAEGSFTVPSEIYATGHEPGV